MGFCFQAIHNNKTIHVEGYSSILTRGEPNTGFDKSNSSSWVRVAPPERWDLCMLHTHTTELIE